MRLSPLPREPLEMRTLRQSDTFVLIEYEDTGEVWLEINLTTKLGYAIVRLLASALGVTIKEEEDAN